MKKYFKHSYNQLLIVISCTSLLLFSCSKEDDYEEPIAEILPPIELACDFFSENRILENDPNRPVDYFIDCWTEVEGSLKIESGVVIAFGSHAGMYITSGDKIFEAKGTLNEPIIFTGSSEQTGYWRGLYFAEAHHSANIIEHAVIKYAGSQNLTSYSPIYEGSLAIRGVSGTTPQTLKLNHVEISNSGNIGLDLHGIETNADVTISNLTITDNKDVPVKISANMAHILDDSSAFSGNTSDFVNITSENYSIESTVSWNKLDVPYLVDNRVHISSGGHLTIKAGVEMQFKSGGYLQATPYSSNYNVSLKILGTEEDPVHLKAANGTNWGGIYYGYTQEENIITHTVIEHAKGDYPVGNLTNSGAIYMHASPLLTVSNTTFKDLPNYAFYVYTGASTTEPDLPNLTRTDNIYMNISKGNSSLGHLGWGGGQE